jgi:hypothetical protein
MCAYVEGISPCIYVKETYDNGCPSLYACGVQVDDTCVPWDEFFSSSSSESATFALLSQPSSKTVVAGRGYEILFQVEAVSQYEVTYRWQHSVDGGNNYFNINPTGGVFIGAETPTLGVNPGMTDLSSVWNGARFRCVVQSAGETITSEPGILTVVPN